MSAVGSENLPDCIRAVQDAEPEQAPVGPPPARASDLDRDRESGFARPGKSCAGQGNAAVQNALDRVGTETGGDPFLSLLEQLAENDNSGLGAHGDFDFFLGEDN